MAKIAIVYWSGTGNTEAMAKYIAEGAQAASAEIKLFQAAEFSQDQVNDFDRIAFGCPSMGAEQLEDSEFEPMFDSVKASLAGKEIALFGSYDWGDGEWMRTWSDDCKQAGAILLAEGLIVNNEPEGQDIENCIQFGKDLAQ